MAAQGGRTGGGGGGRDRARRNQRRGEEPNRNERKRGRDNLQPGARREGDREKPHAGSSIEIGSTGNSPELLQTIPIVTDAAKGRRVVLSFGAGSETDLPLPKIAGGDRLEVLAELELTTDAPVANHPGRIGNVYAYAPKVEATLLLAADPEAIEAKSGRAIALAKPWADAVSHEHHHAVVTFGDGEVVVPTQGLPWQGPSFVNVVVSASHPKAKQGDLLLVGQNEKTPTVVQDMAGIRVVRFRPATAKAPAAQRDSGCLCAGVPIAKQPTVVFSHELTDAAEGERLLVKARLVTDAAGLGGAARISTRLFLATDAGQLEPDGSAKDFATWKGHLSKVTGFNCLPGEGPRTSRKYGVATIRETPGRSLYVNLVAVSAAPFGGTDPRDVLRIDTAKSMLEVTRLPG